MHRINWILTSLLLTCGVLAALLATTAAGPAIEAAQDGVSAADRAAATAMFIDTPRSSEVIDEGLRIAEALRRHYGIDTGHRHADRLAAARRAKAEVLDRLEVTPEEVRRAATDLGYDLDPARCANSCGNVEALARIELKKRALRALADEGAVRPGV